MQRFVWAVLGCLCVAGALRAEDVAVETVLKGLQDARGIAIRPDAGPDKYEIYVADAGTGRIVRIQNTEPGSGSEAITGFTTKPDALDPTRSPGPCGLLFVDRTRLVVTGSDGDGRGFVRLYELTDEERPLVAEQHDQQIVLAGGNEQSDANVDIFCGVARTRSNDLVPDFLVTASLGDDGTARVWKAPLKAGTLGKLELFRSNEPRGESSLPAAIAVTPQGYVLISKQDATDSQASRLIFVNPLDGKTALQLTVNMREITGLAYSPGRALLYAIGFESRERRRGSVYRIDAGEPGQPTATVKVGDVERPTAIAFGPDGALYVTSLGTSDDSESAAGGVLLKFTGKL